jgi:hypothetical protein
MVEGRGRRMKADQWVDERDLDFCVWFGCLGGVWARERKKGFGFLYGYL